MGKENSDKNNNNIIDVISRYKDINTIKIEKRNQSLKRMYNLISYIQIFMSFYLTYLFCVDRYSMHFWFVLVLIVNAQLGKINYFILNKQILEVKKDEL